MEKPVNPKKYWGKRKIINILHKSMRKQRTGKHMNNVSNTNLTTALCLLSKTERQTNTVLAKSNRGLVTVGTGAGKGLRWMWWGRRWEGLTVVTGEGKDLGGGQGKLQGEEGDGWWWGVSGVGIVKGMDRVRGRSWLLGRGSSREGKGMGGGGGSGMGIVKGGGQGVGKGMDGGRGEGVRERWREGGRGGW